MPWIATLSQDRQEEAARLYASGLSAQQVANHLDVSLNATFYALRKLEVARRTSWESNRLRYEAQPLSYSIKHRLSPVEERLKLAAIMLYWAEGYKIGKDTVDFANSDPYMVCLFLDFLREICRIDERKIRCFIYAFDTQNIQDLECFWANTLKVKTSQFTKPQIKSAAANKQGHRMRYGLVHIRYCDKKLLRQILVWIDEYKQTCVGGRVVNCRGL